VPLHAPVKAVSPLALLAALWLAGCASNSLYLTPRIAPAVTEAGLNLPSQRFSARVNKGFLEVELTAKRTAADYQGDLNLELESAAKICAALAWNGRIFQYEWQELELKMWTEFGSMLKWHTTVSFVSLRMNREALRTLRDRNLPPSACPQYWNFVFGSKVVPPDSGTWKEWQRSDFEPKSGQKAPPGLH
jgi:hypothetical protein